MDKTRTKKKRSFGLILLTAICSCLVVGGTFGLYNKAQLADAQVKADVSHEIEEEYAFGDEFVIPECSFEKGEKTAVGVASLEYPDGTQIKEGKASLNQSGRYVLRYIATIDGKAYTKEYEFSVVGKLVSYASGKTSVEYGECTDFGANSTGLMVKIANGDALTFDHVFDMTQVTTSTKLLEGFIVPGTQGKADFSKMVFTFTDVEDPSVKLVYNGNFHNDSNAYGLTFFTAAGNGQIQTGLECVGKLHVGGTLGCMVPHSFLAMDTGLYWGAQAPQPVAPDQNTFCISYDYKTNQAWAGGKIISDLDDSNYYDKLWFGFPSGKAKLTISAANYNEATANICFTSILGIELSAENYMDKNAPEITIDNDYETMPNAVVGGSYPVPSATAFDQVNGKRDVQISVWHNYGMETQKMVDVVDGKFKVDSVGAYAIVYEAVDYSGNVGRSVLWVKAYLSQYLTKLSVKIDEDYNKEIKVGTVQTLPDAVVSGGCGENSVIYTITKGKESCEIVNGSFCLEEAGEWTLTCTAVDYVGNVAVAICSLQGVISDEPIITQKPQFPIAYVSESTYDLPMLYAYDYKSGEKVEKLCSVTVEYGGKTQEYKAGESFTPVVNENQDKVKLTYSCGGFVLAEAEIPVLIVFSRENIPNTDRYREVISVEKYFQTDADVSFENNQTLSDVKGMMITVNEAAESVKTTFANAQMANGFSLDFLTVPNQAKFSQMNITLTDSVDPNVSVKASLRKDDGQTLMTVGDTSLTLSFDFDGASSDAYNIGFEDGKLIVNTTTSLEVAKTEKGEEFNGFPSGKIIFDVELCDAEVGAQIFLYRIFDINVSNKQDNTGPFVSISEDTAANAFKDSIYTVKGVIACDFLCPNVETKLTVLTPDGSTVTSTDGVLLEGVDATRDYDICLSEYGEYYVSVSAVEASSWKYSNMTTYEYLITVVDGERPTITFKQEFKNNLKVGDVLIIPEYEVSDNFTSAENITVMTMITNPKGLPIYLYDGENALRCEYAGVYKIKIYVCDEMGNLTIFETSITVQ